MIRPFSSAKQTILLMDQSQQYSVLQVDWTLQTLHLGGLGMPPGLLISNLMVCLSN